MKRRTSGAIALACALIGWAGLAPARELQGVTIAEHADIADWGLGLRLSGAGLVYRRYLPFQTVALYVERAKIDPDTLPRGMAPCRVVIHWLTPEIDADDAGAYWHEQFNKQIDGALTRERLQPSIERVVGAFGAAKRDDELVLDYHPDRGLRVNRNGKAVGQFAGLELNRLILGLWLGPQVPGELRSALLEGANPPAAAQ